MRNVIRVLVVAAALVAPLSVAGAASAASTDPVPQIPAGDVVYDVGCWTTFRPPAPQGAPMTQYYANCDRTAWHLVCPAVTVNGAQTVYRAAWQLVGPYAGVADQDDTAVWHYPATIANGRYTTVEC